jgi:hypothetical protein
MELFKPAGIMVGIEKFFPALEISGSRNSLYDWLKVDGLSPVFV